MSRIHTIQDYKNTSLEESITKLKQVAIDIKDQLNIQKKDNVKHSILVTKLTDALRETKTQLNAAEEKLRAHEIEHTAGAISVNKKTSDLINSVTKLYVNELKISDMEMARMGREADDYIANIMK
jgi:hypothetical protein